jgi:hypothetical protein
MRDNTLPDGSRRGDEVTLRKLMTEFANKIPEQEFSLAEMTSRKSYLRLQAVLQSCLWNSALHLDRP